MTINYSKETDYTRLYVHYNYQFRIAFQIYNFKLNVKGMIRLIIIDIRDRTYNSGDNQYTITAIKIIDL